MLEAVFLDIFSVISNTGLNKIHVQIRIFFFNPSR